jgi:hypothetical protein
VKVVLVFSANELDLGVPNACEVRSAVVLQKIQKIKNMLTLKDALR